MRRPPTASTRSGSQLAALGITVLSGLAAAAALAAGHLAGRAAAAGGPSAPAPGLAGALAVAAALLLVAQGALVVGLRRRLAASEARARAGAATDELTGVGTRRFALERLADELARARRYGRCLSVALLDLDDLAAVNAAVGADGGDAVLRAAAGAVRAQLRRSDAVGRLRDDELLVVLPETDAAGARAIAERLRLAVAAQRVLHAGISLEVTASAGVATWAPGHGPDRPEAEALLSLADQALFQAKAGGRNQVAAAPAPQGPAGSVASIQPPPSSTSPS